MSKWKTIESVPEGTMVLFCSMSPNIETRHWAFVDYVSGRTKMMHPKWDATHWQPLPPPPKGL